MEKNNFKDFVSKNKNTIKKLVDSNTQKNENGVTIIKEGDPWRNETEWDEHYQKLAETEPIQ